MTIYNLRMKNKKMNNINSPSAMENTLNSTNMKKALFFLLVSGLILTNGFAQTNSFPSSGNAGIGTTSPAAPLEINTTLNAGDPFFQFGNSQQYNQVVFRDRDIASFLFGVQANQIKIGAQGNEHKIMSIQYNAQNIELWPTVAINSPSNILINAGQNVGIGSTNPQYKLDVNGVINATGININGTSIGNISSLWSSGSNGIYYNSGNVGIGTTTPNAPLEIGVTRNAGDAIFQFGNAQQNGQIIFRDRDVASFLFGVQANQVKIGAQGNEHKIMSIQSNAQNFELWPTVAINSPNNILINAGQNVGIGTTSPQSKLDINGTAHVAGTVSFDSDLALGGNLSVTGTLQTSGSLSAGCVSTACLNVSGTTTIDKISTSVLQTDSIHAGNRIEVGHSVIINGTSANPFSYDEIYTDNLSPHNDLYIQTPHQFGITKFNNTIINANNNQFVGIGTTSPASKFEVVAPNPAFIPTPIVTDPIKIADFADYYNNGSILEVRSRSNSLDLNTVTNDLTFSSSGTEFMRLNTSGSFGIGTSTPLNTLDVFGSLAVGTYAGLSTAPLNGAIISGNVGIGTSDPQQILQVNGPILLNAITNGSYNSNTSLFFGAEYAKNASPNNHFGKWGIQYVPVHGNFGAIDANSQGGLNFWIPFDPDDLNNVGNAYLFIADGVLKNNVNMPNGSGGVTPSTVTTNGYVGIGTADPSYKLDVAGVVNAQNYLQNGQPLSSSQWTNYTPGINTNTLNGQATNLNASDIYYEGRVTIGMPHQTANLPQSSADNYTLFVGAGILTEHCRVALQTSASWSDYVFNKDYKLKSVSDLKEYVNKNHHLPGVPSAEEVAKNGIDVAQMDAKLLEKIEELTLYIIQMKNEINGLHEQVNNLKQSNSTAVH